MKKFIETILNIYNIQELRGRIITTLSLLLVYRLGAQIVLPGIDSVQLAALSSRADGGGLLGILNAFTGGAFANASVFALGIMPYISASIVVQLMGIAVPYLQKLQKEGESGNKKRNQITRWLTISNLCCSSTSLSIWTLCIRGSRQCFYSWSWSIVYDIFGYHFGDRNNICNVVRRKDYRQRNWKRYLHFNHGGYHC